ncbi:MAG TPA: hypothetical protein VGI44_00785 [Acidimicrobiales bacterium]
MRALRRSLAPGRRPVAAPAVVLSAVALSLLVPELTPTADASTHRPAVRVAAPQTVAKKSSVASCTPSQISTSVTLYVLGSAPTAPAGAVLFHNISSTACSLQGVPTVGVLNAGGQRLSVYEPASVPRSAVPAVLQPSSTGSQAGSSLTWSSWSCPEGSFSLAIRFPGWSTSVPASWGSVAGYSGTPCAVTGATVYVSTVANVSH